MNKRAANVADMLKAFWIWLIEPSPIKFITFILRTLVVVFVLDFIFVGALVVSHEGPLALFFVKPVFAGILGGYFVFIVFVCVTILNVLSFSFHGFLDWFVGIVLATLILCGAGIYLRKTRLGRVFVCLCLVAMNIEGHLFAGMFSVN